MKKLEEQQHISPTQLKGNKVLRRYVEHTLHLAVEACLDIGSHVIADSRLREPEDYKDIMTVLAENDILPKSKLGQYQKLAPISATSLCTVTQSIPKS